MKDGVSSPITGFRQWFFAPEDARTAAALRIAFCLVYLLMLLDFHPAMQLLFGHRGLFGTMEPLPYRLDGLRYLLFRYDAPWQLELWFNLSVAAALAGLLGLFTRWSLALTLFSMMLFRERGPYMTFGADLVLNCIGVLLFFAASGKAWSLDNLRRPSHSQQNSIEGWPVKAIQIQIALIYAVTGLVKIRTVPWRDGSAVYYALQVGDLLRGDAPFRFLHNHFVMAAMTYGTLVIELGFPLLVFHRRTRTLALLAAAMMHTGIDMLMSIRFFSLTMYVGYLAFLRPEDWKRLTQLTARFRVRSATLVQRNCSPQMPGISRSAQGE